MVNLNRKADIFENLNIAILILCQTYTFINKCRGLSRRNCLVWGALGTHSGHAKSAGQTLLWHQDCNDLMFYVVYKGLKDCMTLKQFFICRTYFSSDIFCHFEHFEHNNRGRKTTDLRVCSRQQCWSFWGRVDSLCRWAAPRLL
ncbi:unnamed protein product [Rangifer tarandus platyrhynchus]|uniref:Uncharacterized protein n=1 Tax=Rangifer tarandus platyrhynchus TaxID=3082113 RepID=A0AC59ZUQ3_RANTA